jgi:hypothetical protein
MLEIWYKVEDRLYKAAMRPSPTRTAAGRPPVARLAPDLVLAPRRPRRLEARQPRLLDRGVAALAGVDGGADGLVAEHAGLHVGPLRVLQPPLCPRALVPRSRVRLPAQPVRGVGPQPQGRGLPGGRAVADVGRPGT